MSSSQLTNSIIFQGGRYTTNQSWISWMFHIEHHQSMSPRRLAQDHLNCFLVSTPISYTCALICFCSLSGCNKQQSYSNNYVTVYVMYITIEYDEYGIVRHIHHVPVFWKNVLNMSIFLSYLIYSRMIVYIYIYNMNDNGCGWWWVCLRMVCTPRANWQVWWRTWLS